MKDKETVQGELGPMAPVKFFQYISRYGRDNHAYHDISQLVLLARVVDLGEFQAHRSEVM